MRKVNFIILGFFLFVCILVYAVKALVQSGPFAKIVSEQITESVFKKLNTELSFSKVEVQLFPPGTVFHNVHFKTIVRDHEETIEGSMGRVEFDFGIVDILSNRLVIKDIYAEEGLFKAQGQLTKKLWEKLNFSKTEKEKNIDYRLNDLFKVYLEQVYAQLPIQIESINLKKTKVEVDESALLVDRFYLFMSRGSVQSRFLLRDIQVKDWSMYEELGDISSLSFDFFLTPKRCHIQNSEMKWRGQSFLLEGSFKDRENAILLDAKLSAQNQLEVLWPFVPKSIRENDKATGQFLTTWVAKGTSQKPEVSATLKAKNVLTPWANLDTVDAEVILVNNQLKIQHVVADHQSGQAELKSPLLLWDLKKNQFLTHQARFALRSLHTNSALRVLSPDLDILKARGTGDLTLTWDEKTEDYLFELEPGFIAEDFVLTDLPGKMAILKNPKFTFNRSSFQLNKKLDVKLNVDVNFPKSHVVAKGILAEKDLDIVIDKAEVNLKSFGPIADVALDGQALVDLHISGPYEDVQFDFDISADQFSVMGFQLGQVQGEANLFLKDTRLMINNLLGKMGESDYTGNGTIAFEKKEPLDLNIDIKKARYQDARLILAPLFKTLTFFPEKELSFFFQGPWTLQGDFDTAKLRVEGDLKAKEVQLYKEDFDRVETHLLFNKNSLTCQGIRLQKGQAQVQGKLSYDVGSDYLEFEASLKKMNLQDSVYYRSLNLGYSAEVLGEFYGSGTLDDFSSKAYISLSKGHVNNISVADSVFNLYGNGSDLFIKGYFLGDLLNFDSYLNLSEKATSKSSYLNAKLKAPDAKVLLGLISPSNTTDFSLMGNIDADLKSSFSLKSWNDFNLLLELNDFWLTRKDFLLKIEPNHNRIIVQNGTVRSWSLLFSGGENSLRSIGEGDFASKIRIQNVFDVTASFAETISEKIQKFGGRLKGRSVFIGEQEKFSHFFELLGENLMLKISDVPSVFEDIRLGLVLNDDKLLIRDLKGRYGKGDFSIDGNVKLQFPYPLVDLGISLKNSYVPLFKKSYAVASGQIKLHGNAFPYQLDGDLTLHQAELFDEFSEMGGKKGDSSIQSRFIPKGKNAPVVDLISLGLNWEILKPVYIKNSMAEMKIDGKGTLKGGNSSPSMGGELNILPGESKIFFKGHEFVITEGKIQFVDSLIRNQADLRISGQSDINQYRVKVLVTGKSDNIAVALSSEPFLAQEDILSLLAIGVTSDISRGLGETERRSMTSLGLGTLLMDQIQINQGITSDLGVRVSVVPEFSEDESAIMAGRTESGGATTSRVKSTTKIKLQKKITNRVDVSVASTLGGTMQQKQEMNINFNLGKNVSLQGVYEVKATENGDTTTNEISAGADLKFKWSFK